MLEEAQADLPMLNDKGRPRYELPPERVNELAIAIVTEGNRLLEEHGRTPSPIEIWAAVAAGPAKYGLEIQDQDKK